MVFMLLFRLPFPKTCQKMCARPVRGVAPVKKKIIKKSASDPVITESTECGLWLRYQIFFSFFKIYTEKIIIKIIFFLN